MVDRWGRYTGIYLTSRPRYDIIEIEEGRPQAISTSGRDATSHLRIQDLTGGSRCDIMEVGDDLSVTHHKGRRAACQRRT
jgi:hypothetical protein